MNVYDRVVERLRYEVNHHGAKELVLSESEWETFVHAARNHGRTPGLRNLKVQDAMQIEGCIVRKEGTVVPGSDDVPEYANVMVCRCRPDDVEAWTWLDKAKRRVMQVEFKNGVTLSFPTYGHVGELDEQTGYLEVYI